MTTDYDEPLIKEPGVNGAPSVTTCQFVNKKTGETCGELLPEPGDPAYHPMRKYCDEHKPKKKDGSAQRPLNVNVDLSGPKTSGKKQDEFDKLVGGATQLLGFIPMGFQLTGDSVCATAIADAVPAIAHQLAQLAQYHPGLKKILAPAESTGEAMVWVGLVLALSPVIIAILSHHGLINEEWAGRLAFLGASVSSGG